MTEERAKRKLSAILSADVKGYSRLMEDDELATVRILEAYREIIAEIIKNYNGRVVDSPGDNLLAEFTSVVDAVESAVEIQNELKSQNAELPEDRRMDFRIGINLGDVIEEGQRIYGDGVNVASRIEGLAEGGGISISGTAFDQVDAKLSVEFEFIGEKSVKNIKKPVRVYRVKMENRTSDIEMRQELPLTDKPSIAVLPFVNMSDDPEQEYFSDGITEDILTNLSKVSGLVVISRNSSFLYKGKPVKIQEVAKDLGVHYVLEGSVRRAGDKVRITAQLIDGKTEHHVWAEKYDRELKDIFSVQDEVTKEELYVHKKENMLKAIEMSKRVIDLDPNFAGGYQIQSFLLSRAIRFGFSESPREDLEKALELAQKAISVDDKFPMSYMALASVYLNQGKQDDALAAASRAAAILPGDSDTIVWWGYYLTWVGRGEEAIAAIKKSRELNPMYQYGGWPVYFAHMGIACFTAGLYEESVLNINKTIEKFGSSLAWDPFLIAAYIILGRKEEAKRSAQQLLKAVPHFSLSSWKIGRLYKNPEDSERLHGALQEAALPE